LTKFAFTWAQPFLSCSFFSLNSSDYLLWQKLAAALDKIFERWHSKDELKRFVIVAFSDAKVSIPTGKLLKVYVVEKSNLVSLLKDLG
jgi:hypothetical protein